MSHDIRKYTQNMSTACFHSKEKCLTLSQLLMLSSKCYTCNTIAIPRCIVAVKLQYFKHSEQTRVVAAAPSFGFSFAVVGAKESLRTFVSSMRCRVVVPPRRWRVTTSLPEMWGSSAEPHNLYTLAQSKSKYKRSRNMTRGTVILYHRLIEFDISVVLCQSDFDTAARIVPD